MNNKPYTFHAHEDSTNIDLRIRMENGKVVVQKDQNEEIPLSNQFEIYINAAGKNGSDGKVGNKGAAGIPGRKGEDAYHEACGHDHPGTNGTNGTNGSPGEAGENGQDGTRGKDVSIHVDRNDLALIDAIHINNNGGRGGKAGTHGRGGLGGEGGKAGASYTYTAIKEVYYPEIHYGHSPSPHFHGHHHHHSHHHHHHHHHTPHVHLERTYESQIVRIPGGYPGTNGQPGFTPSYPLYPGQNGADGSISFLVSDEQGRISTWKQPYKLTITSAKFNGFRLSDHPKFEYGQMIDLNEITVKNNNPANNMPSPIEGIPIQMVSTPQVKLISEGYVDGNILANDSRTSCKNALIQLQYPDVKADRSVNYNIFSITLTAQNTRLDRPYQNSAKHFDLDVGFPIQLKQLEPNLAVISGNTLNFETFVEQAGDSSYDIRGRQFRVEVVRKDVAESTADNQKDWGYVFSTQNADDFETENLTVNLYWPRIDKPDEEQLIQQQHITVQINPSFISRERDYLLVINSRTSLNNINQWKKVLESVAHTRHVDTWNTSLQGQLNEKAIKDTKHGSIIILDETYPMSKDLIIQYNQYYDISTIVAHGGKLGHELERHITMNLSRNAARESEQSIQAPSIHKLIKSMSFHKKLSKLFDHCQTPYLYHKELLKETLIDLKEEQIKSAKLQTNGTFWQYLCNTYQRNFTEELICLNQLVNQLKTLEDSSLMFSFIPLVTNLIANIQYHAEQHTSFWTWLASFFMPQVNEELKKSTLILSQQALFAVIKQTNIEINQLQDHIVLRKKLLSIVNSQHQGFFSISPHEKNHAQELLNACDGSACNGKSLNNRRLNSSKLLKPLYDEFDRLFASAPDSAELISGVTAELAQVPIARLVPNETSTYGISKNY